MAPRSKSEEYKILSDIAKEEDFPLDSLISMYMVESTGDSQVVNELGYTGGFQFGKVTGEEYGLVGEGFDYRKDLGKSAKAAIKMSKKNMKNTGDWKEWDMNKRLKNLDIPKDLAAYLTHQQGRAGTIDIITGASSGKIAPTTRKTILSNLGTSTAEKAKKMGDKELVSTYLDFWKSTWQTKGVEAAKGWTEDAQVNTNIAFAARNEIKKNAANTAFDNMEKVNEESDVNIASIEEEEERTSPYEPTPEMIASRKVGREKQRK